MKAKQAQAMVGTDVPKARSRLDPAQWLGLSLLAVLIAIPVLHLLSEAMFGMKQSAIEAALRGTLTQADFIREAEGQGMACKQNEEAKKRIRVWCDWWDAPVYDVIAWIEFVGEGVVAVGYFVDGDKSGEYLIRKDVVGP